MRDGRTLILTQVTDPLQENRTNLGGCKPAGVWYLGHFLLARAAPVELIPDDGTNPWRKQVQGKWLIHRHLFCPKRKEVYDGRL
jgi:hypothetical protein